MGLAERYAEYQAQQAKDETSLPAICRSCGSDKDVFLYANDGGTWVKDLPVYASHYRCFLCFSCVQIMEPEQMSLIESNNRQAIRTMPITDKDGKYLPGVKFKMLEMKPHFFPAFYLGEHHILASAEKRVRLVDCWLMELIPEPGQDYWCDVHTKKTGHIITSFKPGYPFPHLEFPCRVLFSSFFDELDRPRVAIWRK